MSPLDQAPHDLLAPLLGTPVRLDVLKDKPGRRRTSRATGPRGTAVVKVYASDRAPVVAARLAALQHDDAGLAVPPLLLCDPDRHVVVLGELPGVPLSRALDVQGTVAAYGAGAALARWHDAHAGTADAALRPHTAQREVDLLRRVAQAVPRVLDVLGRDEQALAAGWPSDTVVHRDLYEEQVLVGRDGGIGLVDLDDAARGPGELDLGNAVAHLRLRSLRTGGPDGSALLAGYRSVRDVDPALLARCTRLALLRLACLHREPRLLDAQVPG